MKIVFFGTPEYVVPVLDTLYKTFRSKQNERVIEAVVTQRPKPTGRKQLLEYSPVDTWAYKKSIPVFFNPNDLIKNNVKADVGVLASFGQILDKDVVDYFPFGIINLHPSLLPKFRGASPVQGALIAGETITGLTFTKMDTDLDKGLLISQFTEEVQNNDTTKSLRNRLFLRGAEVIKTLLPAYLSGKTRLRPLSNFPKTFTKQINKEDAFISPKVIEQGIHGKESKIDWKIPFINNFVIHPSTQTLDNFIRAMVPWPVAWTTIKLHDQNLRIKILRAHLEKIEQKEDPSSIQKLVLDEVQLEGKTPVTWRQFKEGYPEATFN